MEQAIKILFILLLIVFPLGQIGRVELGGGVNLLLNDVVVGLVALVWATQKIYRNESFQKTPLTKPILLFFAVMFLSLFVNSFRLAPSEVLVSSLYLVRWICYAVLYFVVTEFDKAFKQKVIFGLLISGTITALIGLLQYFLYPNLRNLFYAGWDEHLFRLFASFLDPNFAGGIFVLAFLIAASKVSFARSHPFGLSPQVFDSEVAQTRGGRRLARLGLFSALVLLFVSMLLTYSRSTLLSFAVGMFTFLTLTGRKKLVMLAVLLCTGGIFLLPKNLGGEGVNLLRFASIEARLTSSQEALAMFQTSPLFGVGFNAYRYARQKLGFETTNEYGDIHSAAGTDNSFLFVLATTGIVGFTAFIYLWFVIVRLNWRNSLVLATIAAIFMHTLFVNSLFYPWVMEWLWIVVAAAKVQK